MSKTCRFLVVVGLLLGATIAVAEESTIIQFRRIDKAILVPSGEIGEIDVTAWAAPVSETSKRFRYTYHVTYREGFPSMFPFSAWSGEGAVPLVGFDVHGDPDCSFTQIATPDRHHHGPWRWAVPSQGSLAYDTVSRGWKPGLRHHQFTFTSACAPGRGKVTVRMTHGDEVTEADYGISGPILTPMKPSVRTDAARNLPPRRGTYADPSRNR